MAKIIRIFTAIATLLTFLGCLGFAGWALLFSSLALEPKAVTAVSCLSLCGLLSFFLINDYRYFFGEKNEPTK